MASIPNAGPSFAAQVEATEEDWATNPRWKGVQRDYSAADVVRLRGSVMPECTLARSGASKLWQRLHDMDYVHALGAMTGGQAIQFAKADLPALYLSGWQVAGDANLAGQVYPDQSLYPVNSVPRSCPGSTTLYAEPIRSSGARPRDTRAATTCFPSWPMPRRASAGRSTPTSS